MTTTQAFSAQTRDPDLLIGVVQAHALVMQHVVGEGQDMEQVFMKQLNAEAMSDLDWYWLLSQLLALRSTPANARPAGAFLD